MLEIARTRTPNHKKQFGQFFTSNCDHILRGLEKYVRGKVVTDPFAGSGDLLSWALRNGARRARGHEIDKKYIDNKTTFYHDSIKDPAEYKFVLTNPPYLNINKADQKTKEAYLRNSGFEDLYHVSLASIMKSEEGIVIVPINFLSSERANKIRGKFFDYFLILEMNYFKHQVFDDTTYNVIAFYYQKKKNYFDDHFSIKTHIYPDDKTADTEINKYSNWAIGGDFINKINNQKNILGVRRLIEDDINNNFGENVVNAAYNHIDDKKTIKISPEVKRMIDNNIIMLKSIDSGTPEGRIALEDIRRHGVRCLVSKPSSRHMIHLIFSKPVSVEEQVKLIELFNKEFNEMRKKSLSLFLTNYRDNDRKRVAFDFVYKFVNQLYFTKINSSAGEKMTRYL